MSAETNPHKKSRRLLNFWQDIHHALSSIYYLDGMIPGRLPQHDLSDKALSVVVNGLNWKDWSAKNKPLNKLVNRLNGRHSMLQNQIEQAATLLAQAEHIVVLSGAGISTASGIPDFRGFANSLWNRGIDPLEIASLRAFKERPDYFYSWFKPLAQKMYNATPNIAHTTLFMLQNQINIKAIVTQNIDGLHQKAGCQNVLELHGHLRSATCIQCHAKQSINRVWHALIDVDTLPRCSVCNGPLKPDLILFDELLPHEIIREAQAQALQCDVMLVIGTSLEVLPAADLPFLAHRRGAKIILLNMLPTPADERAELVINADATEVLPNIEKTLLKNHIQM